jgi:hypothetical protein
MSYYAPVLALSDCPFLPPWVGNTGDNFKESRTLGDRWVARSRRSV